MRCRFVPFAAGVARFGRHEGFPVFVVAVFNDEADGRTEGGAFADTAFEKGCIFFDIHAGATAVAALATMEVFVDIVGRYKQTGRYAADNARELWTVGFTSCNVVQSQKNASRETCGCRFTGQGLTGGGCECGFRVRPLGNLRF